MPQESWFLLQSGPCPAVYNMALDEALLESMPRLQKPVLRFYGWTEPAASFGYFQKYRQIEALTLLRPLVRRPTGGGLVPHDTDWTYSMVFPDGHEWYGLTAIESYRRMHQWIQTAFQHLQLATNLAASACKAEPGQCFVGHEKFDLLWQGRKVAGAAQRRSRDGLLIQGSVQPPPLGLQNSDWIKAMSEVVRLERGLQWVKYAPDAALRARASQLERQKYLLTAYQQKR